MDALSVFNEFAAVLGFAVPSAVLWQVWQIKRSYDETKEEVEKIRKDVAWIRRHIEDRDLVCKTKGNC